MIVYFTDDGLLVIEAENNTEMMALEKWGERELNPVIMPSAHHVAYKEMKI